MGGQTLKGDAVTFVDEGDAPFDCWTDETPDVLQHVMWQMQIVENAARTRFLGCVLAYKRSGAWRDEGARDMAAWLVQTLACNPSTAREFVTIAETLAGLPRITAAFEAGLLCWDKVRTLCTFATAETDAELAMDAAGWSHSRLRREATRRRRVTKEDATLRRERRSLRMGWDYDGGMLNLSGCLADIDGAAFAAAVRHGASVLRRADISLSYQQSCADSLMSLVTGDQQPKVELIVVAQSAPDASGSVPAPAPAFKAKGPAIDAGTMARLAGNARVRYIQGDLPAGLHDIGRRSRRPVAALMREVMLRDNWQCGFTGCYLDGWLELHHHAKWSEGGGTDSENLAAYCDFHHDLLHKGWSVGIDPDGSRTIYKPDGTPHDPKPPRPEPDTLRLLRSLGIIPRRE